MIPAKQKLEQLNRTFRGKPIQHCKILGNTLNFEYDILEFCCSSTRPTTLCETEIVKQNGFRKEDYVSHLVDTVYANQEKGICTGCKSLEILSLMDGTMRQCSPDCGTREMYHRVKQRDCFDTVWEHIGRYCSYPAQVTVKYIVFSWNSSRADLDGFVAQCKKYGVEQVVISGEGNAIFSMGVNGKLLCDSIQAGGIPVKGFIDNDPVKQTEQYCGLSCLPPKDVSRDARILIFNTNYRGIWEQLETCCTGKIMEFLCTAFEFT